MLKIEVIYALPNEQKIFGLEVKQGTTLETAIKTSGVLEAYPEIDLDICEVGIYSQRQKLEYVLFDKDRVEIYRDLLADPKEVRRKRAEKQREKGIIK